MVTVFFSIMLIIVLKLGVTRIYDYLEKNKLVYLVEFGKLNPIQYGIE